MVVLLQTSRRRERNEVVTGRSGIFEKDPQMRAGALGL
jgi:hypothetical protein